MAVLTIVSFIDILGVPYRSPFGEDTHIAFWGGALVWYLSFGWPIVSLPAIPEKQARYNEVG